MLQLTPQSRIFLAIEPVDFRAGIDRLAAFCRERLAQNPLEGAVYVFRNRRSTALKLLVYDGQGFWLCYPAPVTGPVPMVAPRRDRGLALVRP
jgi:transposase